MSVKLGTLTLDLVTKIGNFVGPINEAESKLTKSFSKMRDSVNKFGLIAVSAGAGAAAAVIAMADTMAKQNAELERFAYLSQTSVAEFQKMSVGAKMMGIEADKLSDIMKDWNERFGDFLTSGGGPLVDFMEQVAVKTEKGADGAMKLAKELSKLSGPESMGLFVKKMEEANLSQDQMSFLMESMASDATQLLPLLKNNAEGMRLWGEAAERAGIIMDEETLRSSRELQVQTQMLDMQYEGLKKQLLSAVIPALVDVSEAMVDGDTGARGMADAGDVLATSLRGVAAIGIGVYATLNLIAVAMAGVTKSAVDSYNITQKAAEQGSWFDKLPGIKLLKGGLTFGVTANAEDSGIGMAVEDSKSILEDSASKLEKIFDSATSTATAKLADLQKQANQTNTAATQGAQDWLDKQNKVTDATKAATQAQAELNRNLEEQKRIVFDYSTEIDQRKLALDDEIYRLESNGMSQYVELAKARYAEEKKLAEMQFAWEIAEHRLTESQKLSYSFNIKEQEILADAKLTKVQRDAKLQALDEQYTIELQKARFHAQNVQQTMRESIKGLSYGADEIFAQATMSPQDYAKWSLENDRSNAQASLKNQRIGVEQDIMTSDAYSTDDERYAALLEAHQEYRDGMAAIDVEYHERVKDLEVQNYEDKLEVYGMLLSQAGTVWGSMTQMVKDSAGEQSSAYKAMFLMQQAIAIGQAIISTELAATRALELGPILGIPASTLVRAMGYASVGLIAGQTIAGMAHNGIDNIPQEGTWLLDKGERVLSPRQNSDLTRYLSERKQNTGASITINNNANADVSARQNADGSVTIDVVNKQIKQAFGRLNEPNSFESKQIQRNTTARRERA